MRGLAAERPTRTAARRHEADAAEVNIPERSEETV